MVCGRMRWAVILVALLCGLMSTSAIAEQNVDPDIGPDLGMDADDWALTDPRDPFEGWNRAVYRFNDGLDRAVVQPVARGYNAVVPAPINKGITNFFRNLSAVGSAFNNLLQLKIPQAINEFGRVAVNTTLGVFGVMDVATELGVPRNDEDLGQTFAHIGAGPGPYLVMPFIGPTTARDLSGWVLDWRLDPLYYVNDNAIAWGAEGISLVDRRADLLKATDLLDGAALDPYAFVKDAYLQRRLNEVYDGNPPLELLYPDF